MRAVFFVLVCVLVGCGGGGGQGASVPPFTGVWSGTWNLSPSEFGTTTLTFVEVPGPDPRTHQFNGNAHNDFDNTDHVLGGPGAIEGDGSISGGAYVQSPGVQIGFTGGQLHLSNNDQTLSGTIVLDGSIQMTLNLTRQ